MKMVPLGEVVSVVGGGTPRKSTPEYFGGEIPWVTPKDMKSTVITSSLITLTELGVRNSPAKLVPSETVLIVVRSGVLKHTLPVALTGRSVTLNQDMKALIPSSAVDGPYLARLIKSLQPTILSWVRATTADNFPIDKLLEHRISLPPLDEQRRVAAILDHADMLRARQRRALLLVDQAAQELFTSEFGDPVRNCMNWASCELGDQAEKITDGEHKTPRRSESGVPLLSARSIQSGWIDFDATDFVPLEEYEVLSRRIQPRTGDVLISCSGTIGRVTQVRERTQFVMVRSVALVRPGPNLSPGFLEQQLSTAPMKALMNLRANSSAQANLFQNQIRSLPIITPPLDRQKDFECRIEATTRHRDLATSSLVALDELFASLQARAFRGEL